VRHLGEAVLDILDATAAGDPARVGRVGPPEHRLVDPVRLPEDPARDAEGLEHLHRAARDAVGLAEIDRTLAALDDHRPDIRERGELGSDDEPGRAGADDEDVDLRAVDDVGGRLDAGITGVVAVAVELHRVLLRSG